MENMVQKLLKHVYNQISEETEDEFFATLMHQ